MAWHFPDPLDVEGEIVGVGADLEPATILTAYRQGIFPMPADGVLAWWSPDPRGVIPLDGLRISRSLRRSLAGYEIRIDTAFAEVMAACADPRRPHGWITRDIRRAYGRLHELEWAHSVEAWSLDDGQLAGGLYGLSIGGLFAGESMFHRRTDASKAALVRLVSLLREGGATLLDVQWCTPHLASLGAVELPRADYLRLLGDALATTMRPDCFTP
ncbi:MAG TPA: leucyl/phenylalanyl-tRNA--protein transferase [Acidimicrobiales bacterium]|nr:leucyl/phenylalanyl-tRNA--protein transferase [Acidimicrobiales bacterium]